MPTAGKNRALHVARDEFHRHTDSFADGLLSANGQNGHGQWAGFALLVLRDGSVERAVKLEAAAQGFGVGGELVDVVFDDILGQLPGGRDIELIAEEDVFASPDE